MQQPEQELQQQVQQPEQEQELQQQVPEPVQQPERVLVREQVLGLFRRKRLKTGPTGQQPEQNVSFIFLYI